MTDDLTLPGSIPGLLRRGSPVTHIDGSRLVVVELDGDDAKLPSGWAFTRLLALDLTDATGRAHAAWWLAARCGSTVPGDACWWCWRPAGGGWAIGPQHPDPAKYAHVFPRVDPAAVDDIGKQTWHSVPTLATLDPDDRWSAQRSDV